MSDAKTECINIHFMHKNAPDYARAREYINENFVPFDSIFAKFMGESGNLFHVFKGNGRGN